MNGKHHPHQSQKLTETDKKSFLQIAINCLILQFVTQEQRKILFFRVMT